MIAMWEFAHIRLPYTKPPLSLNSREHWAIRARKTRMVRRDIALLVRAHPGKLTPLPEGWRLKVQLHYKPRDSRRRDTDNLIPTLKAICDGLGPATGSAPGAGLVADDTPEYMIKPEPLIHKPERLIHKPSQPKESMLWVTLTPVAPNGDQGAV